jgi:hypothetical protein
VIIEDIRFEVVPHPTHSMDLAPSDFWLLSTLQNISKRFIPYVIKKLKLLQEKCFENSLNSSTATGSKNLFNAGSVVSNKKKTM